MYKIYCQAVTESELFELRKKTIFLLFRNIYIRLNKQKNELKNNNNCTIPNGNEIPTVSR